MITPAAVGAGLSLVELVVSTAIVALLAGVGLTFAAQATQFATWARTDDQVEYEATRAFDRLSQELRRSGWSSIEGNDYPQVSEAGDELRFRVLGDLDGNGFSYDEVTGISEWGAEVFAVRLDPEGALQIFDQGNQPVLFLAREVTAVRFATHRQDASLHLREIRISILVERSSTWSGLSRYQASGSVNMRN